MLGFTDILAHEKIDASGVITLRHRPKEPKLNRALSFLALEKPEIFNAYQQTQGPKLERAMQGADYVASFIAHGPGKALFIGLYKILGGHPISWGDYWKVDALAELQKFGYEGFTEQDTLKRSSIFWFHLERTEFYKEWSGKLVVAWSPPEISWWRRAHLNSFPIVSVLESNHLERDMPAWEEINFSWEEIKILPSRWKAALAQWRGIYLIFDESDGKSYVGSAYGAANIRSRWEYYASTGHGDNKLLLHRDPRNFRFSILQRVSPDMPPEDIIRLEGTWKTRLHTRHPSGLNLN